MCPTLCDPMDCSTHSLSITNSWSLLKFMSTESVMPSNHLILCHPLLLLPSIFSSIRVLSNKSVCHIKWPKYWSFNFSISHSNEYSGLISFGIDWFDPLAVQGTLKSLLQHYSAKASILQNGSIIWNFCEVSFKEERGYTFSISVVWNANMCCLAQVVIFTVLDNTLMRQQQSERNLGK